ncbi:hypothetical protein ES706_05244 [subsurface metagenome]
MAGEEKEKGLNMKRHPEGTMNKGGIIALTLILAMAVGVGGCITTNPPATENKPEGKLIRDLAYMKATGHQYSDDADPEPEGAEINLLWYDSKSNLIFCSQYKDITLQVTIEILAGKSGEYPISFTECVYKTTTQVKYPFNIRIPFKDIKANTEIHNWAGNANLTIHTPQQGEFPIEDIAIPLFPYEKLGGEKG